MLDKFKILLPFLVSCVSCGSELFPKDSVLNPTLELGEFREYVESFVYDGSMHGVHLKIKDLIIKFDDLNKESRDDNAITLGRCHLSPLKTPKISIDRNHWSDMDEYDKTALMYHELGHCILRRGHTDNGISLMNPFIISSKTFSKHYNDLVKELFTRKPLQIDSKSMLNLISSYSSCQYHNHETEQ